MYHKVLQILFVLILSFGCKETVVEYIEKESPESHVILSVNKVEIGQKITANFVNTDSVKVYAVTFNRRVVTFNQRNDSTVSLFIPKNYGGNESGNFVLYCETSSGTFFHDSVFVSNQINYIQEDKPFDPWVKWNDDEKIIQEDAFYKYYLGGHEEWSLQSTNDTITFIRTRLCHDECSIKETLVFKSNGNDILPMFLYANFERNEMMVAPISEHIYRSCKIIINEWNSGTSFSGTFTAGNYSWVFWAEE